MVRKLPRYGRGRVSSHEARRRAEGPLSRKEFIDVKYCAYLMLFLLAPGVRLASADSSTQKRISDSAEVLGDILSAKDRGIPEDLLEKAQCVGVVPNLKRAGFIVGAKYGKGIVVCRENGGRGWSAPSTVRIEGGSVGLQIGAGETDVVFIVMNKRGMDKLMEDKFTIGADERHGRSR